MGFVADTIPPTLISDAVTPTESAVGDPSDVETWVEAPVVVVLDDCSLAFPQLATTNSHNAHAAMLPTRCPDLMIPPKDSSTYRCAPAPFAGRLGVDGPVVGAGSVRRRGSVTDGGVVSGARRGSDG
jgi:hypothetical protein